MMESFLNFQINFLFSQVKNLQKKIQATESAYDVCTEDLFTQVTQNLIKWKGNNQNVLIWRDVEVDIFWKIP